MKLRLSSLTVVATGVMSLCAFMVIPSPLAAASPSALPSTLFSNGPAGATNPDDITLLNSKIYVTYQNSAPADGSVPGAFSTIAEFDLSGNVLQTVNVTGRVDGLTADPVNNRLIATINEDNLSSLDVITTTPTFALSPYDYSPNPATGSPAAGGTDSISIVNGGPNETIIVAHSNPFDNTQPTDYSVSLIPGSPTGTANLTPLFTDNTTDATGAPMNITDPDSNTVIPAGNPVFGGQFLQDSQADGVLLVTPPPVLPTSHPTQIKLSNTAGGLNNGVQPTLDDTTFTTAAQGTLYVVDQKGGKIYALDTTGVPSGTAFGSQPRDGALPANQGALNYVDLSTGSVTPLSNSFVSPKGLLFIPSQGPPPGAPEVPFAILLPLSALAIGAIVLLYRRHRGATI